MATNKLGAAFLRCSLGPLHYAGGLILASNVADGLRELSVDNLRGGLERGLQEAAQQVGVPVSEVERLLPMASVAEAAARLDLAQKNAVTAWGTYAGNIGGLLKGVADLTVDGRAPDVANFLERLSRKVIRDRPLSEPLHALSVEVASWLDLVERCGELLADGGVLSRAYRRRQIRRASLIGGAALAMIAAIGAVLWVRAARGRVEAALAAADPCAALGIDASDLDRASSDQKQRAEARRVACDEQRKKEAEALAAQQKKEAEARAAEQARRDHQAKCEALAAHLEGSGDVTSDDEALAPGKAGHDGGHPQTPGLLHRIGKRALERSDMSDNDLPCADAPAAPRIAAAFATAVIASPAAWSNAEDLSESVRAILLKSPADLPPSAMQQLGWHADQVAKRALIQKNASVADQATRLCKLKDDLGVRGAKYCATLAAVRALGKL